MHSAHSDPCLSLTSTYAQAETEVRKQTAGSSGVAAGAGAAAAVSDSGSGSGLGRNSGSQMTLHNRGGTLFSWGLNEWRLARNDGDLSVPEPALPELKVGGADGERGGGAGLLSAPWARRGGDWGLP